MRSRSTQPSHGIHGVMAEFESPEELIAACQRAYAAGYRRMDAYSPMPVEGLRRQLDSSTTKWRSAC